ncbi:uncharacterized protein MEPE_01475 [Melanopsichium pennsylvanicum]|uniref:Uncharacterized protein n=2 Tax=Melanopsichium pennsylvanicum TaxID=63383 RepID=A0AAJ5C3S6_9BASI|nr:putative protein [Melanopsichium pennsylvanicum 4]SNX82769.1 uncharacterized protein MEPE_01475 [Melanopsichium pennsylvanicum]
MENHRLFATPAQHTAQPSGTRPQQTRLDGQGQATSPHQHGIMLPPDTSTRNSIPAASPWIADPTVASPSNDLPPKYDSHQFPPTPPALQSSNLGTGSYFDQSHHAFPEPIQPANSTLPPSELPPRSFGSRFPRWGTWLEKRALERHYARLEQHALAQQDAPHSGAHVPNRKKSWGTWVNGPDAINDDNDTSEAHAQASTSNTSSLPPLHLHHFGSRFIPHLPAQPLCSILVELVAPARHNMVEKSQTRQVLLVGTAQGLFAIQFRHPQNPSGPSQTHPSASSPSSSPGQWNDNIRCVPIWSGLAVYQMCVLASKQDSAATSSRTHKSDSTPSSGVFLALTCPSSARDGFLTSSLMQLSAHAGSVLESVVSSAAFASSSSSSSHQSQTVPDLNDGVAAANFGSTAGGGPGRAVPPGGTGVVRMWHLQAIRELLSYALDRQDAQVPINLAEPSSSFGDKRAGLGSILKKTFSKPKTWAEAKSGTHERSASSASFSATINPLPRANATTMSASHSQQSLPIFSSRAASSPPKTSLGSRAPPRLPQHDPDGSIPPQTSPPSSKRQQDPAHAAALSLASSSVPIQPPSHATAQSYGHNASFTSLFADDLIQSFSAGRQAGGKGKDREAGAQSASKGVLFFSIHQAGADTKGSGTWYLAIAYARSVMVYEASMPRSESSRAWSFVKELYAPFPIKAVAFAPAAVSDELHPFTGLGPGPANTGPTKLRVASAEGPLSTLKKGSHRDRDHASGSIRESGGSSPINSSRTTAAPASWQKADLCLLLSFGRRAVLVRLRDSHVREMDLKPLSQILVAAADGHESGSTTQLSLQPNPLTGTVEHQARFERSRPLSTVGDGALWTDGQMPSGSGHSRPGSMEQRIRDSTLDKRSNKHNWVGFSNVEARIFIRQWSDQAIERKGAFPNKWPQRRDGVSLSPMGLSIVKSVSSTPSSSLIDVDKDLPRVPANQNASFDRRMSRLHLPQQISQFHDELQADSSSDSSDDIGLVDKRERAAKYQLTDPGPLPHKHFQPGGAVPSQSSSAHLKTPHRSFSLPPAELVSARLAFASRGAFTHVMQLPLAADLAQAAPLAVMQWSDTPNAVSGWARVLGVERSSFRGNTPSSQLKQSSTTLTSSDPPNSFEDIRSAQSNARRRNSRLILHVGVTCVAFLPSRIESRKASIRVPVTVDFDLSLDSELELIPLAQGRDYSRANGTAAGLQSSTQIRPIASGEVGDDSTSVGDGWRAMTEEQSFAYPSIATPNERSMTAPSAINQELEYLCAPLLTLHPIDLDPHSCGSQSLVLPFPQRQGQRGQGEEEPISAAHALFPDLAGDAGVVAFDWRGADDFRIFTVGIAG